MGQIGTKEGGTSLASKVVTEVDKACEKAILTHLLPTCETFDLALLSEESEDESPVVKLLEKQSTVVHL